MTGSHFISPCFFPSSDSVTFGDLSKVLLFTRVFPDSCVPHVHLCMDGFLSPYVQHLAGGLIRTVILVGHEAEDIARSFVHFRWANRYMKIS